MADIDEARFAEAVAAGAVLEAPGDHIDADLIRAFCLRHAHHVDPRGIRLGGVHVSGTLDLTSVSVPFALGFTACTFDHPPVLHGARVKELSLFDCTLPGLLANGIDVQGDLDLSASRVVGRWPTRASNSRSAAIWLCESTVGGRLRCIDTTIDAQGERALQADRMRVGGTVRFLNGFDAKGELRLVGLQVSGSLDMTGAHVESDGLAVDLADATIAGNMFIAPAEGTPGKQRRPRIHGRINLSSTRIDGRLEIRDAALVRPERDEGRYHSPRFSGKALVGLRLFVGAELLLEGTTTISGGIDLASAELGRFAIESGSTVEAPGEVAIDLTNAEIRSAVTVGEAVRVRGTTLLVGARIRGRLDLDGAALTDPQGHSLLKADGATIDGDVTLKRVRATGGQLKFWRSTVGGGFDAEGAVVENPDGGTVRLHQSEVGGSVRLIDGFISIGCVVLSRTAVGGRLDLGGGHFHCPRPGEHNTEGAAIRAVSGTFRGGMDLGWAAITPAINVTDTATSVLQDDPSNWPERIYIAGFSYERFDAPRDGGSQGRVWDWERRLAWLRQQSQYDAGPYEQAARVFRGHGYVHGAEQLLIRQRSDARRAEQHSRSRPHDMTEWTRASADWTRNAVDWVYDWTVGYGFRPGRVLWLLAALLALVGTTLAVPAVQATLRASDQGVVFTTRGPVGVADQSADPCGGGQVRCFNPLLYAVDTVVPLVALDQRSTWYPDRFARGGAFVEWWLNLATVAGWLLSSIFLLSFARLARNT
ncbi:MAG TPA: hypothetical protein VH561_11910 [Micromonosporaceae bacterium]|jgi:hypothetical protein